MKNENRNTNNLKEVKNINKKIKKHNTTVLPKKARKKFDTLNPDPHGDLTGPPNNAVHDGRGILPEIRSLKTAPKRKEE